MNKLTLLIGCLFFLAIGRTLAQNDKPNDALANKEDLLVRQAEREYSIIVYERPISAPLSFEKELSSGRSGEDWVKALADIYRQTFAGKVVNLSSNVLGTGISLLVKAFNQKNENQYEWYSTIQREMSFTKKLPMQTEIADFYSKTSNVGALDPEGMMFNGLGCRQYITYQDSDGIWKRILVFEVSCSLDDSRTGKQRILHHGKFEIKVDSIKFNPFLCDLPNDSLSLSQVNNAMRIPFDFNRRKNLLFRLDANIVSSWMNEAIEITEDRTLGKFQVEFVIPDSTVLDTIGKWKGYYTYYANSAADRANPKKNVTVSGDCFIVPRSFIGNYKEDASPSSSITPLWGTGQYRVDMQITEVCQMNEQYYEPENKWEEEWKVIKKRKKSDSILNTIWEQVKNEFDLEEHKWVYTVLDPVKSVIIINEEKWINHIIVREE